MLHCVAGQDCIYELRRMKTDAILLSTYYVNMKLKGLGKHTKHLSEYGQYTNTKKDI
jgi:hypothetical protein